MYMSPQAVSGAMGVPVMNSLSKPGMRLDSTKLVSGSGAIGKAKLDMVKVPGIFTQFLSSLVAKRQYNLRGRCWLVM